MTDDKQSMFFKVMNFVYTKIIAYGYIAEILLFIFIVFLIVSILFLFLNSKYFRFVAKEKLSFFKEYVFFFLKEKYRFIRSFIFTVTKMLKNKFGIKLIIFFIFGSVIILGGAAFFIYLLKTKYLQ